MELHHQFITLSELYEKQKRGFVFVEGKRNDNMCLDVASETTEFRSLDSNVSFPSPTSISTWPPTSVKTPADLLDVSFQI